MKKVIWLGLILIAVWAVSLKYDMKKPDADKKVIKIGVVLPLTGDAAHAGQSMLSEFEVLKEDVAQRDLKNKYEFIIEDNVYDTKVTANINSKLLGYDKVNAIIDLGSRIGYVTSTMVSKAEVIHFSACSGDARVSEGKYTFAYTLLPEEQAELVANYAEGKYDNVAIVGLNEASSEVIIKELKKEFDEKGIKYKEYYFNRSDRNIRDLIEKSRQENPDLYILTLFSPSIEIFMKQFIEAGVKVQLASTHFLSTISDYGLIEGAWFSDYADADEGLRKRIVDKNNGEISEMCVGYIYDIAHTLIGAFEKTESDEKAFEYLRNLQGWEGVTGKVENKGNGLFSAKPSLKKIENGKMKVIEE
ncbi:MAG: ABC transporter substrate-binding protein [Lactobacillus sp.]|nr:ABC transporter substrate-binding protein [Lactobacillus sp.]